MTGALVEALQLSISGCTVCPGSSDPPSVIILVSAPHNLRYFPNKGIQYHIK